MQNGHPRMQQKWTPEAIEQLRQLVSWKTSMPTMCRRLGRSERAVRVCAARQGIALDCRRVSPHTLSRPNDVSRSEAIQLLK